MDGRTGVQARLLGGMFLAGNAPACCVHATLVGVYITRAPALLIVYFGERWCNLYISVYIPGLSRRGRQGGVFGVCGSARPAASGGDVGQRRRRLPAHAADGEQTRDRHRICSTDETGARREPGQHGFFVDAGG